MQFGSSQSNGNRMIKRLARKILTPWLWGASSAEVGLRQLTWSQFGEDLSIALLFPNQPNGFYVDVGAFHPIYFSNTHLLHRMGWNGINIDANSDVERVFKLKRPRDRFINAVVSQRPGNVQFTKFGFGAFNCVSEHAETVDKKFRHGEATVDVVSLPLSRILSDANVDVVDFLNVDCEGIDLEVLQSNDWNTWKPKAICVEDHSVDWQNSDLSRYLAGKGYSLRFRCGVSTIFEAN